MRLRLFAAGLALAALGAGPVRAQPPTAQEAKVVDYPRTPEVYSYPVVDYGRSRRADDDRRGRTTWRVVDYTGNCCENYLTSDPLGTIYDFGGRYINFTTDDGLTWKSVQPLLPFINGEGAIVLAPGGDVLGVEWDPYSGDHLVAFKYEASEDRWLYHEMPLHTPFYDREWIAVIPGPFELDGETVPYVSFVKGGWPSKEPWLYSTDGLTYTSVTSKFAESLLSGGVVRRIRTASRGDLDWIQPNTNSGIAPLGTGRALASPDWPFEGAWSLFDSGEWRSVSLPHGDLRGRVQTDSVGRLHNLVPRRDHFLYRISSDRGRSWKVTRVQLPPRHVIEEVDFRANRSVGIAAVAVHAHDRRSGFDQDLLFKLDITGDRARLDRLYEVGKGDVSGASGVGASVRFDFATVAILPDGRVATSFYDSTTTSPGTTGGERVSPSVAIELRSRFSR